MGTGSWLGLRHVALRVRDAQESKRFWVDVLGFRVEWEPDPDNVYLTSGQDNLALHTSAGADPKQGALDHLGLVLTRPEDVDEWAERLTARGVTILKPVKTHRDGARSFYFLTPDGITVQVLFHPPLAGLPAQEHRPRDLKSGG